jgi:hypothetical protein
LKIEPPHARLGCRKRVPLRDGAQGMMFLLLKMNLLLPIIVLLGTQIAAVLRARLVDSSMAVIA